MARRRSKSSKMSPWEWAGIIGAGLALLVVGAVVMGGAAMTTPAGVTPSSEPAPTEDGAASETVSTLLLTEQGQAALGWVQGRVGKLFAKVA